ncbi:unnamed protein product [Callosobruchus maculatus]|uniref:Uncharacterized protein n=1 Tax=Callosobruchus maculatus TaxID=64391 RepID=A0A653DGK5_CALMS|nr:unnamed protein product [Callosobruchus maculatus]
MIISATTLILSVVLVFTQIRQGAGDKCLTCLDSNCKVRTLEECDTISASSISGLGVSIESTSTSPSFGCLELEYYVKDLDTRKLKQCIVLSDDDFCQNAQRKAKIVNCQIHQPLQYPRQGHENSATEDFNLKEDTTQSSTSTQKPSPATHSSSTSAKPTGEPTTIKSSTTTTTTTTKKPTEPSTTTTIATTTTTKRPSTQTPQPSTTTTTTVPPETTQSSTTTEPSTTATTASPSPASTEPTQEPTTSQTPTPTPEPDVTTPASASFIAGTKVSMLAIFALVIRILQ